MTVAWSAGTEDGWSHDDITPYQDWWLDREGVDRQSREGFLEVYTRTILTEPRKERVFMPTETVNPAATIDPSPGVAKHWKVDEVQADLRQIEKPCPRTVILGVVDAGIALGHRRFRMPNGQTRFLAAWQQSARYGGQSSIPYGQELYAPDIDRLLREHSGGDLGGDLDEEAFNRAAGLVAPEELWGHRSLDYRAAHGTHVLDLAAGFDPQRTDEAELVRNRIIAVNLPPRSVHGTAGNFLAFFARNAVERIIYLADALWKAHYPDEPGGFPVVINFSFGLLAGPKDGSSPWELDIRELVHERNEVRGVPTRFVMPTGNNNLSRANARELIGKDGDATLMSGAEIPVDSTLSVPWRLMPSDHTSNFVEIWTKARDKNTGEAVDEVEPEEFRLWVTPPGFDRRLEVPVLSPGQYSELSNYARIYCYRPDDPHRMERQLRAHFVICVAPTICFDADMPEAPAGLWEIALEYPRTDDARSASIVQEVTFTVQSDQSGLLHAVIGRQSYFDHSNYETHSEDGRTLDSFGPGDNRFDSGPNLEPWNRNGPVQRKGTQNALATWDKVIVVGGYRITDGTPAPYSSTFDGNSRREQGREVPSVLYPSDDGPGHFGMRAAGSRDGSVVALRGTSMASAIAARDIVAELRRLADAAGDGVRPNGPFADEQWLRSNADSYRGVWRRMKRYNALKQGAGPVPMPDCGRIPRFGTPRDEYAGE